MLPPEEGDPIGSFVVLSNDGVFKSDVISSDKTALVYSEVGDTFNISLTSQTISNMGMIETKALGLHAVSVIFVGNYLVAVIGGGLSLLNEGQLNAPVVGVVIMSVTDGKVSASAYLATSQKAFAATLTSP